MEILGLGHSSFLLEMGTRERGSVRILVDPWLGDYLVGDLLGRWPRLRFPEGLGALGPIDAIWISHSHTDHCDPESLVRLYQELDPLPKLLLPQSLRFLDRLLTEHLPGAERVYLGEDRPIDLCGVRVEAFFNPEQRGTNEDDVMVLSVRNDFESFLAEADALLPFYDPATQARLAELLLAPDIETACFLTIKNEGASTMSMLSARHLQDRDERLSRAIESTYEELWSIFCDPDDGTSAVWSDPRVVRLVGGQGIAYPQALETGWNQVLFPIGLAQRVEMEREVADQAGFACTIEELVPGDRHRVERASLVGRQPSPLVEPLDRDIERRFDPELELFDDSFRCAPLRDEPRDHEAQKARIERLLNERFLPWLIGARNPPVEHLLAAGGGAYRIWVRFGTEGEHHDLEWRSDFEHLPFRASPSSGSADEHYWANDLEDILDGKADEFSTFIRRPIGAPSQRLWCALGMPYLNNDVIERKLRHHFERAKRGERVEDWVLGFHR